MSSTPHGKDSTAPATADAGDDGVPNDDGGPEVDGRAARAQRRREQRRDAIVEAAKQVFLTRGYLHASVADIIETAQIARGTFYLYFDSKQDVFRELIDQFLDHIRGRIRRISLASDAPEPLDQLRANFGRVIEAIVANEDLASLILRDPTDFDEKSRAQVNTLFEPVLGLIKDALRVGQSQGIIRECDVQIVAVTALGAVREALTHIVIARRSGGEASAGAMMPGFADPQHAAEELMSFILRGVYRDPA